MKYRRLEKLSIFLYIVILHVIHVLHRPLILGQSLNGQSLMFRHTGRYIFSEFGIGISMKCLFADARFLENGVVFRGKWNRLNCKEDSEICPGFQWDW